MIYVDMLEPHARIAKALGPKWPVEETYRFSLATLRELVRTVDRPLYEEICGVLERGDHIYQPVRKRSRR